MTQTQKRHNAYVIAGISVVASLMLWTYIVSQIVTSYSIAEKGTPWQGIISNIITEKTELEAAVVTTVEVLEAEVHEAAPAVEEVAVLSKANLDDELDQWELHQSYSMRIPSIDVRVPVLIPSMKYWDGMKWDLLEEQMQVGLSRGSVAYPHSVYPGNVGSVIIAGHSSPPDQRARESVYGNVFRKLPELTVGDEIHISVSGSPVTYVVESTTVVPATATTILQQQADDSILKLITCFPVGTTRDRFVVTAKKRV